jgi:hypothetical protein
MVVRMQSGRRLIRSGYSPSQPPPAAAAAGIGLAGTVLILGEERKSSTSPPQLGGVDYITSSLFIP